MFCSHCGSRAAGNFCHHCGTPLLEIVAVVPESPEPPPSETPATVLPCDWSQEIEYARLLQYPEVRARLATAGSQAKSRISGEQVLEVFDALVPTGVSLSKLVGVLAPLYSRMGINTGKSAMQRLDLPPGQVLAGLLCTLAQDGIELADVEQAVDGCVLQATIPSDLWSLAGQLIVSVKADRHGTEVEAATKIPGQLYDWGKSKRLLDRLFREISVAAA